MDFTQLAQRYTELLLALNTLVHELGVPLPLMPSALLAGAQATEGQANAAALVLVMVLATLAANSLWFAAGRRYGGRVLSTLCRISLSADTCVGSTEAAFTRYGRWALVLGHFLPGVSLVAPPLAGALGMRWPVFLGLTTIGAFLYGAVLVGAGMALSDGILELTNALVQHGTESTGVVLVLVAAYVGWRWRRRIAARALEVPRISVGELRQSLRATPPPAVFDVRGETMRQADPRRIPGALPATLRNVHEAVAGQGKDDEIVVYCACPNDASAAAAVRILKQAGYSRVRALRGGLDAWFAATEL
jgi:membrane protein DedA with SNARE-associated domain/rhodanese-related sulfurtransferase